MGSSTGPSSTVRAGAVSHDGLRLGLMSAGLRVWATHEEPDQFPAAHQDLVRFCLAEVLPHLEDQERRLREAQEWPEKRLLAQAMRAEARAMEAAVEQLVTAKGPCEAMALTRVLHSFLAAQDHHERLLAGEEIPAAGR